jgi:hypothetical protein
MLHVARVWYSFPVTPLEAVCGWTDDFVEVTPAVSMIEN